MVWLGFLAVMFLLAAWINKNRNRRRSRNWRKVALDPYVHFRRHKRKLVRKKVPPTQKKQIVLTGITEYRNPVL